VFVLTFTDISGFDLANLLDFFRSAKGRFDATWTLTINGTTYSNMALDSDDFVVVEQRPNCFTLQVKCRQVVDQPQAIVGNHRRGQFS
jgi:hypothetical protein